MIVYTVTNKSNIESVFKNGWSRQFAGDAEGVDYGIGQYCNIPTNPNQTPYESIKRYNMNPSSNCIIKNKLEGGLNGFLIFDLYYAKKIYGERYTIKDQVYTLLPKKIADEVWNDMVWYMSLDKSVLGNSHHFQDKNGSRTAGLLQFMMSKHLHRNCANPEKYEKIFAKYGVRGAIYHGTADGFCMVAYNYDEIIPIAVSVDGGKTYKTRESAKRYPDATRKFGHNYKKVDYPVAISFDGTYYYFSRVLKTNGKYNIIDAKTGDELSPIDFESMTQVTPPDGEFSIEYPKGVFHNACPDGFYDENGNGHSFDELNEVGTEREDEEFDFDLDEDTRKKFDSILNECVKKTMDTFGISSFMLLENSLDEFNYDGVEINDISYFDSPSVPSIYHVTNREAAKAMFKTGYDREFTKVAAYGVGVYTAIDVANGRNQLGSYGDTMVQFKLIGGYRNFLVFEERVAQKLYGEHHSILSQLKTFLPHDTAHEVFNLCRYDVRRYAEVAGKYKIHGAIYQWGPTIVVLPFDVSLCFPYAVSYDGGRTFTKEANQTTFERFASSVDVTWRYGDKYKKVEKSIKFRREDGTVTGYSRVIKKNGKWNIIDIQTGEDVSPVDFDSCTPISVEPATNGDFQVELNGEFYDCNVEYYKDQYGNRYDWSTFPNFEGEEDDIDFDDIDFGL